MITIKSYTKIRRIGHNRNCHILDDGKLILKEKMDGCNFRVSVTEDGEFVFGSKNVEYRDEDGNPVYTDDHEKVDGRFTDGIQYIRENCDPANFNQDFTYFMENMVPHSLDYEYETSPPPQVIGFDIYDHETHSYKATPAAYEIFHAHGIETAPLVNDEDIDATEFDHEEYEIPESNYRDGKMEGVVIINVGQEEDNRSGFSTRAKMVTEEFAEKHKKATGANQSKEAVHGYERVVSKYCTEGRIRKHIQKMRDEGRDIGMELMGNEGGSAGLPIRVSTDIIEEEADEIVRRNDELSWKDYRSLVAKRCVYVLRQEITRNAG